MSTTTPTTPVDDTVQDAVQRLADVAVETLDTLRRIARAVEALSTSSD